MDEREKKIKQLGLVALLFGIGLCLWGGGTTVQAWLTNRWPTVEGQIISSVVEERVDHSDSTVKGDITDYVPVVKYSYEVAGTSYRSDVLSYSQEEIFGERGGAAAVVGSYPPGTKVVVYHHPSEPGRAVLQPGITAVDLIPLGLGVFFLGAGLLLRVRPDIA